MRWIVFFAVYVLVTACGPAAQPESARTVAAFEVPLQSEADRNQFLAVLRAAAAPEGMHVDAENSEDLKAEAPTLHGSPGCISSGVDPKRS
jgi:hypothetical protein